MSIYDDYNKPKIDLNNEIEFPITDQLSSLIDFDDNVIYITDVIEEPMLAHFIIKTRALIKKNNPATINVIINSAGGSVSEAWGIVCFYLYIYHIFYHIF
jgi:ATP-dependent protease ClpP protease subunit